MPQLDIIPEIDGFAFRNSWTVLPHEAPVLADLALEIFAGLDEDLAEILQGLASASAAGVAATAPLAGLALGQGAGGVAALALGATVGGAVAGVVSLGGWLLSLVGIGAAVDPRKAAREAIARLAVGVPSAGYCGGMAALALDHWKNGTVLPRGVAGGGPDPSAGPGAEALRAQIFARLVDTLRAHGKRFLTLTALHAMDPDGKGTAQVMREATRIALAGLMAEIDAGRPALMGYVQRSVDPTQGHQLLCTGYEVLAEGEVDLTVMDSNLPDQLATMQVRFGADMVTIRHPDLEVKLEKGGIVATGHPNDPIMALLALPLARAPTSSAIFAPDLPTLAPARPGPADAPVVGVKLAARGWGETPRGAVLVRGRAEGTAQLAAAPFPALLPGAEPLALALRLPMQRPGRHSLPVTLNLWTQARQPSVVPLLRALGVAELTAMLENPLLRDHGIRLMDQIVRGHPAPALPPLPMSREVPLRRAAGLPVTLHLEVRPFAVRIRLDGAGTRCEPTAYPGSVISLATDPAETFLPPEAWLSWSLDGALLTQDFPGQEPLSLELPAEVGRVLRIAVVAYDGAGEVLAEDRAELVVNDEAMRLAARAICAAERIHLDESAAPGKLPGWMDPDWRARLRVPLDRIEVERPDLAAQVARLRGRLR